MTTHAMTQIPDKLLPELIDPANLAPGDYLRDLGRLRPVASVTAPKNPLRTTRFLVCFADAIKMDLDIPGDVEVTVWREP